MRTLLFALLLLTHLTNGQDTTARYRATLPAGTRQLVTLPRTGGGYLNFIISQAGTSPFFVDSSQVYNWGAKFSSERAYTLSRLTYERGLSDARYRLGSVPVPFADLSGKPLYYPADTNSVIGLGLLKSRFATKAQLDSIRAGGARDTTAYSKLVADARFALATATKAELLARAPARTIAQLRSTAPADLPGVFYALDKDKTGLYYRDLLDTSTPDDSVTTIVAADGGRYKWQFEGEANLRRWGVSGALTPGDTNVLKAETAKIQKAVSYIVKAANPALSGSANPYRGRPATLYFPAGTYLLYGTVTLPGSIRMTGDGGLSYGGTLLYQLKDHAALFTLGADTDGGSNCVQLENMRLRQGTPAGATASIISNPASNTFGAHSFHAIGVWFQSWEKNAVDFAGNGDDLWLHDCVFDGTLGGPALSLGSAGRKATNVSIVRNTFYDMKSGVADLISARNVLFSANRIYANTYSPPYVLNAALTASQSLTGLTVQGNTIDGAHGPLLVTKSGGFNITGNSYTGATTPVLDLVGSGTIQGGVFTGNTLTGIWSTTLTDAGTTVYQAPVRAYNTGLVGTLIGPNVIQGGAGSYMALFANDARNSGSVLDMSGASGFSLPPLIASPIVNAPRGMVYSGAVSTAGWSVGSYTTIVTPGLLADGQTYLLRYRYDQPGNTVVTGAYVLPIVATYAGAATSSSSLTGNTVNFNNDGKAFLLRYKAGTGTMGLEAAPSASGMSGTLTYTISLL